MIEKLTKQQRLLLDYYKEGYSPVKCAKMAGYKNTDIAIRFLNSDKGAECLNEICEISPASKKRALHLVFEQEMKILEAVKDVGDIYGYIEEVDKDGNKTGAIKHYVKKPVSEWSDGLVLMSMFNSNGKFEIDVKNTVQRAHEYILRYYTEEEIQSMINDDEDTLATALAGVLAKEIKKVYTDVDTNSQGCE